MNSGKGQLRLKQKYTKNIKFQILFFISTHLKLMSLSLDSSLIKFVQFFKKFNANNDFLFVYQFHYVYLKNDCGFTDNKILNQAHNFF